MARLNKQREKELTPKRIEKAVEEFIKLGFENIVETGNCLIFIYKGETIRFFHYSVCTLVNQ